MTEREKMLAGMLYNVSGDQDLVDERNRCKDLCYDFNQLRPSDKNGQTEIMKKILGKTSSLFKIRASFWCLYGFNIEIGDNFYMNHNCVIMDAAKVIFGSNVFIAPGCGFHTVNHSIDLHERISGLEYAKPITVGDGVWFGAGAQVMPGVTIGIGAVIGAGSIVTRDIPANVVAVGNPCRVIREISQKN